MDEHTSTFQGEWGWEEGERQEKFLENDNHLKSSTVVHHLQKILDLGGGEERRVKGGKYLLVYVCICMSLKVNMNLFQASPKEYPYSEP